MKMLGVRKLSNAPLRDLDAGVEKFLLDSLVRRDIHAEIRSLLCSKERPPRALEELTRKFEAERDRQEAEWLRSQPF